MTATRREPQHQARSTGAQERAVRAKLAHAWHLYAPRLAGARPRDLALACVGACVAIALVGLQGALVHGDSAWLPWIVAPVGASAVLVFAVPASPMAQPWPVIGGNGLSALCGAAVARVIHNETIAAAAAVGLAIAVMSLSRSLHPPGGAAAMTAALGGTMVDAQGWLFPLVPLAMNAAALVLLGWAFHRFSRHAYPHVPIAAPDDDDAAPPISEQELDAVLARVGDAFDIEREDLLALLRELEARERDAEPVELERR
jgi:CBS domain-containing membrane protein